MRCKALLLFAPRPPRASTDEGPVFSWTGLPLGYRGKALSAGGMLFSCDRLQMMFRATALCRGCSLTARPDLPAVLGKLVVGHFGFEFT